MPSGLAKTANYKKASLIDPIQAKTTFGGDY